MKRDLSLSVGECMIEMAPLGDGRFQFGIAGDTLNTAWYARAYLPAEKWDVSYFTRLGKDPYSRKIRSFLDENDIGTDFLSEDETRRPGLYMIEIESGERSFTYWRDTSAAKRLADNEVHLQGALDAAKVIYFSGITLSILDPDRRQVFLDAIGAARKAGKMTVFDPNIRPRLWESNDTMRQILEQAARVSAICLPSFDDEAAAFGDVSPEACLLRYLGYGCELVVVKNGGGPMWFGNREQMECVEGLEKIPPVDTTGAGDSFNGAFLAALLAHGSFRASVLAGHDTASQVIRHKGALMPLAKIRYC